MFRYASGFRGGVLLLVVAALHLSLRGDAVGAASPGPSGLGAVPHLFRDRASDSAARRILSRFDERDHAADRYGRTPPLATRAPELQLNPLLRLRDPTFSPLDQFAGEEAVRRRVLDAFRGSDEPIEEGVDWGGGERRRDGRHRRDEEDDDEEECVDARFGWMYRHALAMGEARYRALTGPLRVDLMPYVHKMYVDRDDGDEYFGVAGGAGAAVGEQAAPEARAEADEELGAALASSHDRAAQFWKRAVRKGVGVNGQDEFEYSDNDEAPDIDTDGVLLLGMHGSDLADRTNVVDTLRVMYTYTLEGDNGHGNGDGTLTDDELYDVADDVTELLEGLPGGYENPLLTFRASATKQHVKEAINDGGLGGTSQNSEGVVDINVADSLLLGDGFLQYLSDTLGGGSDENIDGGDDQVAASVSMIGPLFTHAHEYGHHIIYDLASEESFGEEEDYRRIELLADAFGSYFLSHPDGDDLLALADDAGTGSAADLVRMGNAAAIFGDCDLDGASHHGTPAQRRCAAGWGVKMAVAADRTEGGDPYHPEALTALFDEDLDGILALDPEACGFIGEADEVPEEGGDVDDALSPPGSPSESLTKNATSTAQNSAPSEAVNATFPPSSSASPSSTPTASTRPSYAPTASPTSPPTASTKPSSGPTSPPSSFPTISPRPSVTSSSSPPTVRPAVLPTDLPTVPDREADSIASETPAASPPPSSNGSDFGDSGSKNQTTDEVESAAGAATARTRSAATGMRFGHTCRAIAAACFAMIALWVVQ